MNHPRWWLCFPLFLAVPVLALAQGRRDAIVIFKDGFHVKGIVNESVREVIWDRKSGAQFPIYSGNFFLNDHVREIFFSPSQVIKVEQSKEFKPPMRVVRFEKVHQGRDISPLWEFSKFGQWTEKGERYINLKANKGILEMRQRVGIISPNYVLCSTEDYKWNLTYFTQEFGPELSRKIVLQIFTEMKAYKALSDAQRQLQLAAFMHEAGWFEEAEKELASIVEKFPNEKEFPIAVDLLAKVKSERANQYVESFDKAAKVGQHQVALDGLGAYDANGWAKIVSPEHKLMAQDLRARYDKSKTDMDQMRLFLKEFPLRTKKAKIWTKACDFIDGELNHDTLSRLDEFLVSANQYELERKNNRPLSQTAEQVLAIAISGWLQGNQAALPDAEAALKLSAARTFTLEYLKTDDRTARATLMNSFKGSNTLPMDVLARLARMIPPPAAMDAEKIDTKVHSFNIEAPNSDGGSYLVQLPPDYHPLRAYPVLIVLHSGRDKQDETLQRFSAEAAKNGFILVAPQWAGNAVLKVRYEHTAKEQALVLDTLRDVRRRFQVDSDRVFLFGWEDGANMALDVALAHPDLFAGVAPMNGGLLPFTRRYYWPNVQYLPLYIIGGERDGHAVQMRDIIKKDWTRTPYACMYVEYKGRASEWYGMEIGKMLSWMNKKVRYMPMKELGRPNGGSTLGEEFRSTRSADNQFYWLRGDNFTASTQNDHRGKTWPSSFRPATFQANLSVGNKIEKGEAKIWNQLNVHVSGMKQASFWITPEMKMELKHPLSITLNGQTLGGMRKIEPNLETMLEELYHTGDRQRLYVAKVDLR